MNFILFSFLLALLVLLFNNLMAMTKFLLISFANEMLHG